MVTDDERRRIAAKLREYASWGDEDDDCLVDFKEWGEVVLNLLDCGDTEGECYRALADLIDPDGGHDAGAGKSSGPTEQGVESTMEWLRGFGGVDRDVLLKLAGEMADDADSCSRSARLAADEGDRKMAVLFASIADDYIERADRIRSALGVSRGDQQKA